MGRIVDLDMRSLIWLLGLLGMISSDALPTDKKSFDVLKRRNVYDNKSIIVFDEQPIKDSTLVHGACNLDADLGGMDCTLVLQSFSDVKKVDELICESHFKAKKARYIEITENTKFRLKKLSNSYVAFVWADEEKLKPQLPTSHLVLSVVNMKACQIIDYDFNTRMRDFHIVEYGETFDVYYHDKAHCGDFMCGETFDSRGHVLNGPATSYLPSEYFNGNTQMCSVQANSSASGHYIITPTDFHLVTADYGKKMLMGPLPFDAQVAMHDCGKEYLGYCWLTNNKRIINCEQFNSKGKNILSTGESLHYQVGTWMAMKNLGASELLLLINRCDEVDACARDTKDVMFHVLKMQPTGKTDELYKFQGLECNNATNIKSELVQKDDAHICATLACYAEAKEGKSVNLFSTCFLI